MKRRTVVTRVGDKGREGKGQREGVGCREERIAGGKRKKDREKCGGK